jgi:DNA invertase Pin-like site-specific DNA recombinase
MKDSKPIITTTTQRPWFAYVRVSTRDQGDNFSPAKQVEAILAWSRANGITVPGLEAAVLSPRQIRGSEFVGFDRQSGKTDQRPDFQRGIELAKAGKIGGMIAYRLDRVARKCDGCARAPLPAEDDAGGAGIRVPNL